MTVEELTVQALADHLDREPEPCRCTDTDRGTDTLGCDLHEPDPAITRALVTQTIEALAMAATRRGHLAQRVTQESLGNCLPPGQCTPACRLWRATLLAWIDRLEALDDAQPAQLPLDIVEEDG